MKQYHIDLIKKMIFKFRKESEIFLTVKTVSPEEFSCQILANNRVLSIIEFNKQLVQNFIVCKKDTCMVCNQVNRFTNYILCQYCHSKQCLTCSKKTTPKVESAKKPVFCVLCGSGIGEYNI